MDIGKQQIFLDRRKARAKEIITMFTDPNGFVVLKEKPKNGVLEAKNIKYFGHLDPDRCTCQSFYHGNSEDYQRTHCIPFQCKHIIRAKSVLQSTKLTRGGGL